MVVTRFVGITKSPSLPVVFVPLGFVGITTVSQSPCGVWAKWHVRVRK